jgi:hypothetical protein
MNGGARPALGSLILATIMCDRWFGAGHWRRGFHVSKHQDTA